MVFEELRFRFSGIIHTLLRVDILLTTIHTTNEAQFEGVDTSGEYIKSVGTRIHKVKFSQDTNRSPTLGVD